MAVLDVNIGRDRVTPVAVELPKLAIPFVLATASSPHVASDLVLAEATNLGKPTDPSRLVAAILSLVAGGQLRRRPSMPPS